MFKSPLYLLVIVVLALSACATAAPKAAAIDKNIFRLFRN